MWLPMLVSARRALPLVLVLAALTAGCAASSALRRAQQAERLEDYDRAVAEYTNALRLKPDDRDARLSLDRARLRASSDHFLRGRRHAAVGKYEEAVVEYELAAELNPTSGEIDDQLREVKTQLRARVAVTRDGKTELQTLIERSRDLPPAGFDLPADVVMPQSLVFREASSRDVFLAVARFANISLAFDNTFRETPVTVDLRNASFESALSAVADSTRTFFRVTAPRTILVIPDTPAKRREYEEEVVRTFYLSNADLKETQDLLRIVLDARRISPTSATNAITIKDTPERIAAAARVIAAIDKARPEVIINVELLEVDRTRLREYGLNLASPASPGLNGAISVSPQTTAGTTTNGISLQTLGNLSAGDLLATNLPALYYRLLKNDTNTRTLANPQLRTMEGTPAQARFGERIPVPVTTFSPIAQGGVAQQPITSYNYENIGVNIDITPRTHHDDEVTLALRIAVQSIAGTGYAELPTFANREISTVIRLRDGETNMLAGLIRDDERRVVEGIPGLIDVPVIGRLFAHSRTEVSQTDIILTLTPHLVRILDLDEADLRAFRVGRDSVVPLTEIALPIELQRPPIEITPTAPQTPPPGAAQPVLPVQPPSPVPPNPTPR
jgi:general secretion pathway protein D